MLQPFSCCRVCPFVDHFVRNQPGSFSTKVCNLEGYLNTLRLCKWFIAISTWYKKSLNSRKPCTPLLAILGQLESLFSKSVAIIQGRPKRDFSEKRRESEVLESLCHDAVRMDCSF